MTADTKMTKKMACNLYLGEQNKDIEFKSKHDLDAFVSLLKMRKCYIGNDWKIHNKWGRVISFKCPNGYYIVHQFYRGINYSFMEHRVIYSWIKGSIPEGFEVNHIDFNRGNNNISNLEIVTHSENMLHVSFNDRANPPVGERSGKAVFDNNTALLIRFLYRNGITQNEIRSFLGRPNYNVSRIVNGKRFGSVEDYETTPQSFIETLNLLKQKQ